MRVEISARELMLISHCYTDKLLDDLLVTKGVDINRPFTKYMDFTGRKLVIEQEEIDRSCRIYGDEG
jgi:hypothetical protein